MSTPTAFLVTSDVHETRRALAAARADAQSVGCVPTMGAFHEGHRSLIDRARAETGCVAVTIFVNPTQFNDASDLEQYPRPLGRDLEACREAGVDLVFTPTSESLYPPDFGTWVNVDGLSTILEGSSRPGHFRGVTTIVLKLLNIIQPDVAYFGAKDYQQQTLIRRMVRDLDVPVTIAVCPTVREDDGLALSSRNARLTKKQRKSALVLHESLTRAHDRLLSGETDVAAVQEAMFHQMRTTPEVEPDYAVIVDPDTLSPLETPQPQMVALVAATVGDVRLIDNLPITLEDAP